MAPYSRLITAATRLRPQSRHAASSSKTPVGEAPKVDDSQKSSNTPQKLNDTVEKTQSELDAELKDKLEAMSGGGGVSGLELEDGKPVAMKRGTRENMFRLI